MSGIYHEWNGTVLTITSDSGTSSADLKGEKGDTGARGAQGGCLPVECSFSVEGAAADAKAVGDAIAAMKTEVNATVQAQLDAFGATKPSYEEADTIAASHARNKNILDNWYFGNPVNQRGNTTYTTEAFCIDRWYFEQWSNTNPQLVLNDGYITLSCTDAQGDTNTNCIKQTIAGSRFLSGKTVTFSVKFRNVTVNGDALIMIRSVGASGTKVAYKNIKASHANSILSVSTTLQEGLTSLMVVIGNYANNGGDGNHILELESAKLELGSVSTLAYDAPPSYAEELLKCQRYLVIFRAPTSTQFAIGATNGSCVYAPVYLPTVLYDGIEATVKSSGVNIYPYKPATTITATSVTGYTGSSRNFFTLQAYHDSNTNAPAQTPCNIRLGADSYIAISAEL